MCKKAFVRISCNGGDDILTGNIMVKTISEQNQPLHDVMIQVFKRNNHQNILIHESKTGVNGKSDRINLESPDASLSLNPKSIIRPYAQYDLYISKNGYIPEIRNGIHIFSGIDSTLEIIMQKITPNEEKVNSIDLEDHVLFRHGGEQEC